MGVTKTTLFTAEQNRLAQIGKCFSHPARIAIIQHVLKANACINSDLVQELGLAQATISQHLKELKNAGIIKGTVEGTAMNYCINPTVWAEIKGDFNRIFDQYQPVDESCC